MEPSHIVAINLQRQLVMEGVSITLAVWLNCGYCSVCNIIGTTDHGHLNELYVYLVALVKKKIVKIHLKINTPKRRGQFWCNEVTKDRVVDSVNL